MSFEMKFIDGTPVDAEYAETVARLVGDGALADVSEEEEAEVIAAYQASLKAGAADSSLKQQLKD